MKLYGKGETWGAVSYTVSYLENKIINNYANDEKKLWEKS